MNFQIPTVPITSFTQAALAGLLSEADTEYTTKLGIAQKARSDGTITAAMLDELDALLRFRTDAKNHLATLSAPVEPNTTFSPAGTGGEGGSKSDGGEGGSHNGGEGGSVKAPSISDVATGDLKVGTGAPFSKGISLVASGSGGGYSPGQEITTDELGDLVFNHLTSLATYRGDHNRQSVFSINRPKSPYTVHGDRSDFEVIQRLVDESRLPGGSLMASFQQSKSLTASAGWCAPSEIDYGIRSTYGTDGLLSLPTMQAPRGGVQIMPELVFNTIYGGYTGTNFFSLTEAQVEAGVPKTFIEIDCPDPVETRLAVDGVGIIGNLLSLRAYPEYSRKFVDGAMVGLRHFENLLYINAIRTATGACTDLSTDALWSTNGSVFTQVMGAIDLAATDLRAHKRMTRTATMEVLLPEWFLPAARLDLARRNGIEELWKQDAYIMAAFGAINVVPQFLKEYQDAYSTVGNTGFGQAAPMTSYPLELEFIIYPPGTFALAQLPVINVSTVYDAVRLAGNQRVELFHEVGWAVIQLLADSRCYSIPVCPTGATGALATYVCETGN